MIKVSNDKYNFLIKTPCIDFKIPNRVVFATGAFALAYTVPQTRVFVKPIVDFAIAAVNTAWYHRTAVAILVFMYLLAKQTGLLKAFR